MSALSTSPIDTAATSVLVFDGIKMGAHISVNGVQIGQVADQFRRYVFPLPPSVLLHGAGASANTLEVAFDRNIDCGGRWMACTGGGACAYACDATHSTLPSRACV